MLTRNGWAAIGLSAVAFATGRVFGLIELYVLGAGMLVVVAVAAMGSMRRPPHLAVRRVLEPAVARAGEAARVDVQVANLGHRRSPVLQLWEPVGPSGGAVMNLAPLRRREAAAAAYRLPTTRRGMIQVGPMQARRRDVLGLCATTFSLPGTVDLLVIPRHTPVPFGLGAGAGRLGEHLRLRALGQSGSEFHSLREYVTGDDLRRISWKASARSMDLLVKETAIEGVRRCTVVVDIDDDAHDAPGFERAMSIAASLVTGAFAANLSTRMITVDVDLRGPDVAPMALRWAATAEPLGGEPWTPFPSLHTGEGLGVVVLVTSSPASRRTAEVRGSITPEETLVVVATASVDASRDRFVIDATSDESFQAGWATLVGAVRR